jgi:membrane-bound lytic murein transglycosylase A
MIGGRAMRAPLRRLLRLLIPLSVVLPMLNATMDAAVARPYEPALTAPRAAPQGARPAPNPASDLRSHPGFDAPKHGKGIAESGPLKITDAALEPVGWDDLDGWDRDDHASAFATFQASCRPIVRSKPGADVRPVRAALQAVCVRAVAAQALDEAAARQFFEANFRPVRIRRLTDSAGFVTGYYEPIVDGSRFPTREFTVPLYRRPHDLVAAGATEPSTASFPNSGHSSRKTSTGELVPYYDRGEIEDGALDGQHLELCWLRSKTEALFIEIQGSARIRLEDGTMMRLNYDAHNGYSYVPVGRVLIERGFVAREEMSMQRIREWMQANPEEANDVRRQNRLEVFFRIVGLTDDGEAIGAQGIPLSAGRSIAVDKALHVYGTPFFIEADLPLENARTNAPFRRTMIAQDTGSAIVGPARADLFFGAGDEAGQVAGRIRQAGRFAMLLPREIDPVAAGANMPLPPVAKPPPLPRPRVTSREKAEFRPGPTQLEAYRASQHRPIR